MAQPLPVQKSTVSVTEYYGDVHRFGVLFVKARPAHAKRMGLTDA
jgi:hypothetical protein